MAIMSATRAGAAERILRGILDAARGTDGAGPEEEGAALRAVERGRPARTVAAKVAAAGGVDDQAASTLRELAGCQLGADMDRWRGLYDALPGYRGELTALLAEQPAPLGSGDTLRAPAPRSVHATLGLLLEHAEPCDAAAALAALPERLTADLLAGGAPPAPALVAAVLDHGDSRSRTALAGHPRLDARVLARLAAIGDARVSAAVYRNPRTTASLRRAIAHRTDTVPLDDALLAELTAPHGDVPLSWLAPLLGSGDPQLVGLALRVGFRQVAQQHALLRVWERGGPDAVRALLDDPAAAWLSRAVVTTVTEALSDTDGDTGGDTGGDALRRLRAECEPYEDPARLPALLATARGTSTLRDLLAEPYAHDLDALAAAHAATPFMPKACEELARHEAADDTQRLAFRLSVLNEPWRAGGRRAGNSTPPAQRLAEEALDDSAPRWAEGMVVAGLLYPVELVRTARPAVHAVAALARLAERDLLGEASAAELRALAAAHLGERPHAWAALDTLLPEHGGTVAELIAEAGAAAVEETEETVEPGPPAAVPPPRAPLNRVDRVHALPALDLLYSLAPADAPKPASPDVLRALTVYDWSDAPGLATPDWFADACAAEGIPASEDGYVYTAPSLAEIRAKLPESYGSSTHLTEHAYRQGVLPADELLTMLPAHRLLRLPHDWRRLAFAEAWRSALARLLRSELGTDPDAWLRLAATVTASEAAEEGLTWAQLLGRAQSRTGGAAPAAGGGPLVPKPGPGTPDEAVGLLERGNHLWAWPVGTLLCLADAEVVDAVLPRLGPDGPWLLAAYLLRYDRTPLRVLDRLLAGRDRDALRVLAAQSRWMKRSGAVERLVDLDDPDVDLALLRHWNPRPTVHRIVTRSRPVAGRTSLGGRVLADWLARGSAYPAGGLVWLCSAEPDLVEELLAREGTKLGLGHQLLGCLRLFEHGGADRLARVAGADLLGRAATTVCAKALAAADPATVLRARLDRELAPGKLVTKLRRAPHAAQAREILGSLPPGEAVDWAALEAAHAEEPIPYWSDVVRLDDVPEEVRLRHAALLHEPGPDGLSGSVRLTRERARHGLGGLFHCAPATQLDGLLAAGLLTGADLLRSAAPAARILTYLSGTARRTDAPPGAAAARTGLAELVRSRLGTDERAWARVAERLTGQDPEWEPMSPVAALLGE
ncbi:hypothetical protein OOK13_26035 [Streptomyces sp. NBC_00378]|uniref:hypothetical protein n=1 Tax=unclassified Streptomyces TaxID=2593676 RepID=UPI002259494A|nr:MULTISPECIES: hypothetical protein [unclassified Streptomyces]MCX5111945.1 hypothetical protein [Streptomyces sp. NBC_00378]